MEKRIPLFDVDEKQAEQLSKFRKEHFGCERGAIGGCMTYRFSPTSLGVVIVLKCYCGKEIDVTDYFNW